MDLTILDAERAGTSDVLDSLARAVRVYIDRIPHPGESKRTARREVGAWSHQPRGATELVEREEMDSGACPA